jgi:uncharacterized protein
VNRDSPHLPHAAQIEAYGKGGFRFAGMSHRGSLLCLPDGIWPCPAIGPKDLTENTFALVFAATPPVDHCLIGSGRDPWFLPNALRARFAEQQIAVETMTTGAAVRTYNILLDEGRRIAALLIAVD